MPFTTHRVGGEGDLASPVWQEIRSVGTPMHLKKGALFQPEGGTVFYVVESGEVRCSFLTQQGKERALLIHEAGSFLNLAHALLRKASLLTFRAETESKLWQVASTLLTEDLGRFPHLAREGLKVLSAMSLTYQAALTFLEVDDFKIRFCRYLALNVRKFGTTSFCLGLTQAQCANTLGVHRATLARAIQSLKKEGVIATFTSERVEILDLDALLGYSGVLAGK